jgi:glycosyltransferase involved in cell wall biosynthesis
MSPSPSDISVVIPMYNAARFIGEALASVAAQTRPVRQVIVVDDGSTDGSAEIVARHPWATLIRRPHAGIAATLNAGLDRADGVLLAFLDADDRWVPDKTERQLAALAVEPGLDMVFGLARRFLMLPDGTERVIDTLPGVTRHGGLYRREVFARFGRFATADDPGHDFLPWFARAHDGGARWKTLDHIVFERRIHDANYGRTQRELQRKAYFTSLRETLARRRAAEGAKGHG